MSGSANICGRSAGLVKQCTIRSAWVFGDEVLVVHASFDCHTTLTTACL